MAARRNQKPRSEDHQSRAASYLSLPPMPPPETTRPVVFCIPDHPDWRASLYSSISLMGSWLAWKRDDDHTGKDVAAKWNEIITAAQLAAETGEEQECMDWCLIIADCIANNDSTQQAIREFAQTDTEMRSIIEQIIQDAADEGRLSLGQRNGNLLQVGDCNLPKMFMQVTTLVDILHETSRDLLQALVEKTTIVDRVDTLISAVPGLGILPFDEILSFAQSLVTGIWTEYEAAWTEVLRDEIRCAMFCAFKDACNFSLEEAVEWYKAQTTASVPFSNPGTFLEELVEYIVTGDISGDIAIYAMHTFSLAIIRVGQEILGLQFTKLLLRLKAKEDESDNDYIELCDDCVEPEPEHITHWQFLDPSDYDPVEGLVEWLGGTRYRAYTNYTGYDYSFVLCIRAEGTDQPYHVTNISYPQGASPQGSASQEPMMYWYQAWQLAYGQRVVEFDAVLA